MAREVVKSNVVDALTLFVGVGGTGCDIVRRVADMCKPGETENINFVCLDTNVNDLKSLENCKVPLYKIQTSNTQTVGNYLNYDDDALMQWFPKNAVLYDKTVSEGAGQVRAISRLALNATIKVGNLDKLYGAIDDLYRKTGKAMKQAMRCVIVSTASGGTGSGMFLPLSMLIRNYIHDKYPNSSILTRALILLPETLDSVVRSNIEKNSQRRNAYATIKELNAFMMKGSGFFEISDELKRFHDLHIDMTTPGTGRIQSLSSLPCDFCFLLDGQNAEDSTLVNIDQYKTQAAQALYEQNIGPMQKKAFSVEDNIIKELSNPGNFGRNRFGGIGASVLKYPYEDVADYIAYDWANDSIGGEGEASKWGKYDYAFEQKKKEARSKGLAGTELPKIEEEYVILLNNASDTFSKDIRTRYLTNAQSRVRQFFSKLDEEMAKALTANSSIKNARDAANELAGEIDYKDESKKGHSLANLEFLRDYERAVKMFAKKAAESAAESLFLNESKTINEKREYTLEYLIKDQFGDVVHPNAMRYFLYMVKAEMEKRVAAHTLKLQNTLDPGLEKFSPDNDDADFDVKFTRKEVEHSIDDLCKLEKAEGEKPGIIEKFMGYNKLYDELNSLFPEYHYFITEYAKVTSELEAYKMGVAYIAEINSMFERFYRTFKEKVEGLERKQDDLVDALRFKKGDSIKMVCATEDLLKELSKGTKTQSAEGALLDSELNGQIFDAIKRNVMFEREMRVLDVVQDDKRIDIFDDILLGYFKNKVRRDCDSIDLNIIEALAMENKLQTKIKRERERIDGDDADDLKFVKVSREDQEKYIIEAIAMGERLAAPGIQMMPFEEPRTVNVQAYNLSLKNMRNFRVTDLIPNGEAVDTISKYELHFFNALYNVTPDKLKKFASPLSTQTGDKDSGLYHRAYAEYSKYIGPDSTKNMMISTHIDKRWDSIAVMPELDLGYQTARVIRIHKAMLYALILAAIRYKSLSASTSGKTVYVYEDSNEIETELVVSNGTLCDEFYEILDAFYSSSAIVEDVEAIKSKNRERDLVKNSNYNDTAFKKDYLDKFIIQGISDLNSEGKTSLFEVPVVYHNSLPNSQRFTSELALLIEAVIEVFREELALWENPDDAKFILCDILKEQFDMLVENYQSNPMLNMGVKAEESTVMNMVFRKIKSVMSSAPEPDDYEETLRQMKEKMYGENSNGVKKY